MTIRFGPLLLGAGAALSFGSAALAASPPPAATHAAFDEVEDAVRAILDEFDAASQAFSKAYREAKTDDERNAILEKLYPKPADYSGRLWTIVDAHPEHPASAEALSWLFHNDADKSQRAAELLLEHHIGSEYVGGVCLSMAGQPAGARPIFERVLAESKVPEVRAIATLSYGKYLIELANRAEAAQAATDEEREGMSTQFGEDALVEWMDSDPEEVRAQGVALLEQAMKEYADVPHPYGGTIGATAEGELFETRHLQVGMIAPEIAGEDLQGVPFKLSDYRGKVIVLDFWGNW